MSQILKTMAMQYLLGPAVSVSVLVSAPAASACLPPPPPQWEQWLADPSVSIAAGRVSEVERSPNNEMAGGYSVTTAVARVRLLDVIQGEFASDIAETAGAVSYMPVTVRTPDGQTITGGGVPCLNWLAFNAGDLALVVDGRGVFTAASAAEIPQLSARLEALK